MAAEEGATVKGPFSPARPCRIKMQTGVREAEPRICEYPRTRRLFSNVPDETGHFLIGATMPVCPSGAASRVPSLLAFALFPPRVNACCAAGEPKPPVPGELHSAPDE